MGGLRHTTNSKFVQQEFGLGIAVASDGNTRAESKVANSLPLEQLLGPPLIYFVAICANLKINM